MKCVILGGKKLHDQEIIYTRIACLMSSELSISTDTLSTELTTFIQCCLTHGMKCEKVVSEKLLSQNYQLLLLTPL